MTNRFRRAMPVLALSLVAASTVFAQDEGTDALWEQTLVRAERGIVSAQCSLGEMILRGPQAARGLDVAVDWYKQAAEQNALCGLLRLADMYRRGQGVEKNIETSDGYYRKALPTVLFQAEGGDVEMQILVAKIHHKAWGVKQDMQFAARWYRTAAEALAPAVSVGDISAAKKLANILVIGIGVKRDAVQAGELYEMAAKAGDRAGQYLAGWMWYAGRAGHPVDHKRGFDWLFKAAEADHPRSQMFVGEAFAQGKGTDKDIVQAAMWTALARERGVGGAADALAVLTNEEAPLDVAKGISLAEKWVPIFDRPANAPSS